MPQEATTMTERTEQTTSQPGAVPARIELEDFIEAVTRGVARALAAEDEVSGYIQVGGVFPPDLPPGLPPVLGRPQIIIGFVGPLPSEATTPPGSTNDATAVRR
jgi:hypothetical protein